MATTTNYGWTTPDDTALVKDGASAIRTLGTSVDTTTKNLNPSTTLGDIEYRSSTANTNTRLGIGSTGQVLTVAGGVPTWATSDDANAIQNALLTTTGDTIYASGASTPARLGIGSTGQVLTVAGGVPSWATASAGAMTKITSGTFTTVSEVSVDNCFTSTYKNYIVRIMAWNDAGIGGDTDFHFRFRNNTPSTITSGYSAGAQRIIRSGTVTNMSSDNAAQLLLTTDMGYSSDNRSGFSINITGFTGSTERPNFAFIGSSNSNSPAGMFCTGGGACDASNIKGFNLKASSGTIQGDYQVYGLEN